MRSMVNPDRGVPAVAYSRAPNGLQLVCESLSYWCVCPSIPLSSEGLRRAVAEHPMWALGIILLTSSLHDGPCVVKRREPMLFQALLPQSLIERLDKGIISRCTGATKFKPHAVAVYLGV